MAAVTRQMIRLGLKDQAFGGKDGRFVVQRTIEYLRRCTIVFKKDIKSLQLNLPEGSLHDYDIADRGVLGARRFLFQNVPQLRFRNPQIPFVCTAEKELPAALQITYESGITTAIDIRQKSPEEILRDLMSHATHETEPLIEEDDDLNSEHVVTVHENKED